MESKHVRLREFYKRLADAPAVAGFDEAYELIVKTMNAVEDEFSGVPYDPTSWQNDGRLYPPMRNSVREVPGCDRVRRFRSRRHNTFIGDNGAIEIRTIDGDVEFVKCGHDGEGVPL